MLRPIMWRLKELCKWNSYFWKILKYFNRFLIFTCTFLKNFFFSLWPSCFFCPIKLLVMFFRRFWLLIWNYWHWTIDSSLKVIMFLMEKTFPVQVLTYSHRENSAISLGQILINGGYSQLSFGIEKCWYLHMWIFLPLMVTSSVFSASLWRAFFDTLTDFFLKFCKIRLVG